MTDDSPSWGLRFPRLRQTKATLKAAGASLLPSVFSSLETEDAPDSPKSPQSFVFTRAALARRSLAMNLGGRWHDGTGDQQDHMDVYMKATTTTCTRTLLALAVGRGLLDVPSALALCGILPGVFFILLLTCLNLFIMHRTCEAPQVLKRNLAFFEDIAFECFGKTGYYVVAFCNTLALFAQMLKVFEHEVVSLGSQLRFLRIGNFNEDEVGHFEMLVLVPLVFVLLVPFAFRTSAKALHWNSFVSVMALRVIVLSICFGAIYRMVANWGSHSYVFINTDPNDQLRGLVTLIYAFMFPTLLPSILADMLNPEDAKEVVNGVVRETLIMYLLVGLLGYLACATNGKPDADGLLLNKDLFRALSPFGNIFTRCARCVFTLKNFTTFPLFFMPWRRLIEYNLSLDTEPPVTLNLPWALKRLFCMKRVLSLVLLSLAPMLYCIVRFYMEISGEEKARLVFYDCALFVPMATSMYLFSAAFTAIIWHKSYQDEGSAMDEYSLSQFSTFFWRNAGDGSDRQSCNYTVSRFIPPGASPTFAHGRRKSSMRPSMMHLDIMLPPSMAAMESGDFVSGDSQSFLARLNLRCLGRFITWAKDIAEELSLLNPAWAKTWNGNVLILAACLLAVACWAAVLADTDQDIRNGPGKYFYRQHALG